MLDLTGIMFSTIMMLMVIYNAIKLDRTLPWFQAPGGGKETAPSVQSPGTVPRYPAARGRR